MSVTPVKTRITSQGLLIPRAAIAEWLERGIEVTRDHEHITIRPQGSEQSEERQTLLDALERSGLLLPAEPLPQEHVPVSKAELAQLRKDFSQGRPLSEILMEERNDYA